MDNENNIEEFLEDILGFSKPWKIEKIIKKLEEEKIIIYLNYPKGTKFECPECGKDCSVFDSKYRELRHLDWFQHKAYIKAKVPRIKCCGGKKMDITPIFKA